MYSLIVIAAYAFLIGVISTVLIARGNGFWIATGAWSSASGNLFVRTRIYRFKVFGWYPFVRLRFRYWVRVPEYRAALAKEVHELLKVQSVNGTWDYSPYQLGLYNGLEIAQALLEQREADLRSPPQQWLCDKEAFNAKSHT